VGITYFRSEHPANIAIASSYSSRGRLPFYEDWTICETRRQSYSARADFVYTVTRDLVRGCSTPLLVDAIDAVASHGIGADIGYWF
jgi:hypothetical protein